MPEIATLLRDVEAHEKELQNVQRNYIFTEASQEDELDAQGQVKNRKLEEHEIFFVGRHQVSRLIRREGRDLTLEEQKKEQERVDKRIEKLQKHDASRHKSEDTNSDSDEHEIGVETFLRICRFVNPRRVRLNGRDAIVFDFTGNPGAQTHGMNEKALHKLSGTVWIDEEGREVTRLEGRFDESFKIGGGLVASIQKGSSFIFEQGLVNNEVWLPTYAEADFGARVLLFKSLRQHAIQRFSNYRKFRSQSTIRIADEMMK